MSLSDLQYMELALRMGRRHMGVTADNPSVGCIIVKDGVIVGRGVTAQGGRPHAETQALAQAGAGAEGADVFVTLEPCAHHGNTPPCCDALIKAGVERVCSAISDPDPRTSGAGDERLRAAGITVESGLHSELARRDLAGFLSRIERNRPYVTLKLAVSHDGMIAAADGEQTAITGTQALRFSQMMRARMDAIMVGAGTVRVDDPSLTCRLPGLEDRSPIRIVVSTNAETLNGTKLARTASSISVWVLAGEPGSAEKEDVRVFCCGRAGMVDLAAGLNVLAENNVGRLL